MNSIWWLGLTFFLTCSPILDLGHFSQVILPIVLLIMPQHLMVGVIFFLTFSPILDWGHFSQVILPIVLQIMPPPKITPTIRCCSQHLMVGGFFLTCSPILNLGHFSQVILPIVLQFMPNHQVLFTASDGWGYFFFDLFSRSGLRAFFTSDFANWTTNYASPKK